MNGSWVMAEVDITMLNGNNFPEQCASSSWVAITPSELGYEIITSTLMLAYAANKSVSFYVTGCSGQNQSSKRITSIWVND